MLICAVSERKFIVFTILSIYREFQGPVTAIASVEGFLVVAWGSRLESHKWTGVKLETTAFHEASVMLTSVTTIKRFLACGDVHKGVSFLQMTANTGAFNSLAKVSHLSCPLKCTTTKSIVP